MSPVSVTDCALEPNHKPTTALAGRFGTIGGTKKPAAARATGVVLAPADDTVEMVVVPLLLLVCEPEVEDGGLDDVVPVFPLFAELELEVVALDEVVLLIVPVLPLFVFAELELEVVALELMLTPPTGVIPALMTRGL